MSVSLSGVYKHYRGPLGPMPVLHNINLQVQDGERIAIVGESGVGKSTLVALICGYLLPEAGTITCDGKVVTGPSMERVVVSQQDSLIPWLSVEENACTASLLGKRRSPQRIRMGTRSRDLLNRFGLWPHRTKFPRELSGGQRRRVELVRALSVSPRVLLLDEPLANLDELLASEIIDSLQEWQSETPAASTIFVTHDIEEACYVADRVIVLGGAPASVVREEPITLPRIRSMAVLETDEYKNAVKLVRSTYSASRMKAATKTS